MIAYVNGTLEEVTENGIVVEVNGIGYNILVPGSTLDYLPGLHQEIKIYTYTCVREDAFLLYGFLEKDELAMFRKLITVNGVGPKGALGILSVMSATDLRFAIMAADSKMIAKAPGIGKKTAERVILDLRDKVSADEISDSLISASVKQPSVGEAVATSARREAVEALVALGYGSADAMKAVNRCVVEDENDTEAILKAALKLMI
ncbi:MAG: Holliday junction branch migration protein RuvA [Lachnospiraceae bacterium]